MSKTATSKINKPLNRETQLNPLCIQVEELEQAPFNCGRMTAAEFDRRVSELE